MTVFANNWHDRAETQDRFSWGPPFFCLSSVAAVTNLRPGGGAHAATTEHINSDDVWTEKTGNSVETKSSRRFEIKGKYQIIMISASIYTVTTLLPLFLVRTCACCLPFRSVFYLLTAFYQPGCKSSASKGMTGPTDNTASALYSMLGFSFN